jgi:hypothetical protein
MQSDISVSIFQLWNQGKSETYIYIFSSKWSPQQPP